MTPPALDLDTLEVLVGPAAWAYHGSLPDDQQVDVERAHRVHGDVRLVAADVLTAAGAAARRAWADAQAAALKAFTSESGMRVEFAGGANAPSGDAEEWLAAATRLRAEVAGVRRSRPRSVSVSVEAGL